MSFQIEALPSSLFADLFALSDAELARRSARRVVVDADPGYPCRVSLADAAVGETVILTHFVHQPHATPFRASHAVYVREGAEQAAPGPGDVPALFERRMMSVRLFNARHDMIGADLVSGDALATALPDALADPDVAYIHLHYAKPGCFAASVRRA